MVSVCRGGPGCPPFLSFLLRGFAPARRGEEDCGVSAPHDEVLLFRQKDPKPVAPGRGPQEGVPVPRSLVCGLRNSLRSDSPRRQNGNGRDRGTAPPGGARTTASSCHARSSIESRTGPAPPAVIPAPPPVIPDPDRGSRVFVFACGVSAPHDEVLLFRQKDPKPVAPGRGPPEGVPVPRSLWCGLRNSLRSDSPRRQNGRDGTGAQPRPQAPRQLQKAKTLDPHACPACPERSRRKHNRGCARMTTPAVMPGLIGHPVSLGFPPLFGWEGTGRHAGRPLQNRGACVPALFFLFHSRWRMTLDARLLIACP